MGADYKHSRGQMLLGGTANNLGVAGVVQYFQVVGKSNTAAAIAEADEVVNKPGVLRNARIRLTVAPGGVAVRIFFLRINGAQSSITITITGAQTQGVDVVNVEPVQAGDVISWDHDGGAATGPAATRAYAAIDFIRF